MRSLPTSGTSVPLTMDCLLRIIGFREVILACSRCLKTAVMYICSMEYSANTLSTDFYLKL